MRFCECERLLDPAPLMIETGVERLESGGLHIAVLSLQESATADMLAHWFGSEPDTPMYKLWHPGAHKHSEWADFKENHVKGNVAGSTHLAKEDVGAGATEATLAYIDPYELYGEKLTEAKKNGNADVVLYAHCAMGPWDQCMKDEKGRPIGGQYVGVGRDTPYGLVLRNHYWLGDTLGLPADQVEQMFPLQMGLNVMNHDLNEFHILGKVIPSYYLRDEWEELGAPEPFRKPKDQNYKITKKMFS